MDILRFLAGQTGQHSLPDGEPAEFAVHSLGDLQVRSGRLAVSETSSLEAPVVVPVPPGTYRVELTRAIVDTSYELRGERFAYVSVLLSDAESVTVEAAGIEEGSSQWRKEPPGGIAGISGLHGIQIARIACLVLSDAEALATAIAGEPDAWYDTHIAPQEGGWFAEMDAPEVALNGTLNTALPDSVGGDNLLLVLARTAQYPILATRDREGNLTGIHVDMLVVGELTEMLDAFEGQSRFARAELEDEAMQEILAQETEAKRAKGLGGWFRRAFGEGK